MSRSRLIILGVGLAVIVALAAFFATRRAGADEGDKEAAPTASVTTAPVKSETLQDIASVYGVVQADPAGSSTVAAPRAVIVGQMLVRQGETVAAGQPLVQVGSAPGSDLAFRQAADGAVFAKTDLARVQRLFDERLVASDQLEAAKKALADANAALAAQQRQGAAAFRQTLTAHEAAVVVSIAASPGDHVAQDAPIMVLARQGAVSVKLGIEPTSGRFAIGQPVTLHPTAGGPPIASHLSMVGRAADQTTKTLDAVAPLPGAPLAIGSAVEADVVTGSHQGLAVPKDAVVFDETGAHVFVIAGGKAKRIFVTAGRNYGDEIEISGPVNAGQVVAVQGAYELEDGMAVALPGAKPEKEGAGE